MDKVNCYSCNKNKNKLNLRKSTLIPMNLLICDTCISNKFEPRWVIILSGRQNGSEHVREFIVKRRYIGVEISASELLI